MSNPSNVRLLYLARGIRGFGDGFATIILPAYLDALGYNPVQIGIVLTGSLLGTAVFTLAIGWIAFVVQSLLALWLFERFDLSISAASVFFFWAGILSASSYPVVARLAGRFGLVNTMVFTHIPSNLFLILAAYSSNLYATLGLLLLRSALSQMDVPTRTSYVMAVVTPPERATAASVTAVPRSLASAISPTFAGLLLTTAFPGLPLIVAGSLKILYDFALLYSFRHLKPPEEMVRSAAAK